MGAVKRKQRRWSREGGAAAPDKRGRRTEGAEEFKHRRGSRG
jgi:hypothetical protein